jgi:hypothetical protein
MKKTAFFFLIFTFAAIWGSFSYLEYMHFFDKKICTANSWFWNEQEWLCKDQEDIEICEKENGKWIPEENTCDYGTIIR